jgi:hypothetical protein
MQDINFPPDLHVFPIKMPSKAPDTNGESWKVFNPKWRFNGCYALACGSLSGNIEALDIDAKNDPDLINKFQKALDEFNVALPDIVIQKTPTNGLHFVYRLKGQVKGNHVLAKKDKRTTLIETRGEGGYIGIDPTPGYRILQGTWHDIPELTEEEHDLLMTAARSCNEYFQEPEKKKQSEYSKNNPWDDFNERGDIYPLLEKHGWKYKRSNGNNDYFCRPGKEQGISASYHKDKRLFYVFTSSTEFESAKAYANTAVLATLEYGGDFTLTAKHLANQGYGKKNGYHNISEQDVNTPPIQTLSIQEWIELIQCCYASPFLPIRLPWINDENHPVAFSVLACAESGSSKGIVSSAVNQLENISEILEESIRSWWIEKNKSKYKKEEDCFKDASNLYFPLHMTFEGSIAGVIKYFNNFASTGVITITEIDQLLDSQRKEYNSDLFSIFRKVLEGETFSKYLVGDKPIKMHNPNIACMFTGAPVLMQRLLTRKHLDSGTISRFLYVNLPDRTKDTSVNYTVPIDHRTVIDNVFSKRNVDVSPGILSHCFDIGVSLKADHDSWAPRVFRNAMKFQVVKMFINERRVQVTLSDIDEALKFALRSIEAVELAEQEEVNFKGQLVAEQAVNDSRAEFKSVSGKAITQDIVDEINRLYQSGMNKSQIAKTLKLSRPTVHKFLKA